MTIFDMLGQSSVLTLLGMSIVFSFLIILVICVSFMGLIARAIKPGKASDAPGAVKSGSESGSVKNAAVVAAISSAVNEYRKQNS